MSSSRSIIRTTYKITKKDFFREQKKGKVLHSSFVAEDVERLRTGACVAVMENRREMCARLSDADRITRSKRLRFVEFRFHILL